MCIICFMEGYTEIVKSLIAEGKDVNAKDGFGATALMNASRNGHKKAVKLLQDSGATE